MQHRVVVTGLGVVSPLGSTLADLRGGLLDGTSAVGPITLFDATGLRTHIAAEARGIEAPALGDRKSVFAQAATREAIEHAQAQGAALDAHYGGGRAGLSAGIGLDLFSMPDMVQRLRDERRASLPASVPEDFLQPSADRCLHALSRELGLRQMPLLHVSACAASTDAIGHALRLLRNGRMDWMIAGGADSMINPMGVAGFCKIQAMTTRNEAPQAASRPFDTQRDGFVLGEGAAMLVLETLDGATRRGARIHAELLGHGNSFDAFGISEPQPEGLGAATAMCRALMDAGLAPEDVALVNAHATSTPKNDPAETAALHAVFGARIDGIGVNATKSMIGHLISASGAVELAAQIACAEAGWWHPTINLDDVDPACRLDHIVGAPRRIREQHPVLMKNSFAFGGQNASLLVRLLRPSC